MADAAENRIAFQGQPGAYSDMACREVFPDLTTLPCASFEDTFAAVRDGKARLAMIPIDNSIAGRVARPRTETAMPRHTSTIATIRG